MLALDVPTPDEARAWVQRMHGVVPVFKVGMQVFYAAGPQWLRQLMDETGARIFLDLKVHDIPNTVMKACESLADLNVAFLTLHLAGGEAMVKAACSVFEGTSTQLLGVTVLTSLSDADYQATLPTSVGAGVSVTSAAHHLAAQGVRWGCPGLVCSPQETAMFRKELGPEVILVNPGIRLPDATLSTSQKDDQQRAASPQAAMAAGASYMVIGRPILTASDPIGMVRRIEESLQQACS